MIFPVLQVWRVQSLDVSLVELDESQVHQHFFLTIWPCKWFYFTNETPEIEKSHFFKVNILIIKVLHQTYLMCDHFRSIQTSCRIDCLRHILISKKSKALTATHPDAQLCLKTATCHTKIGKFLAEWNLASLQKNCFMSSLNELFLVELKSIVCIPWQVHGVTGINSKTPEPKMSPKVFRKK